jgi:hypothetical protein
MQCLLGEIKKIFITRRLIMIDSLFTVLRPAQEFFHLCGYVTIAGEGLQNVDLCSTLRAFDQVWIFIVPLLHTRYSDLSTAE